jgi:hypothetical protein
MADNSGNDHDQMNAAIRRARAPKVKLGADGRTVEWVDDPRRDDEPAQEQEPPPPLTRPTGDIDQGVRGTLPAERSMNDRLRAQVRVLRYPPAEYYDRGDNR